MHPWSFFVNVRIVERRKVLRVEVNFPVAFSAEGFKGKTLAKQISEFGVLIGPLDHPQMIMDKHVRLQFALPGCATMDLKGFCAYTTTSAAGIRFETMPEKDKSTLAKFVNGGDAETTS